MKSNLIIEHKPNGFIKKLAYKIYVIGLLAFVVWSGFFMYPLIYWEFQYLGNESKITIDENEPEILKMKKLRYTLDNEIIMKKVDLGDMEFSEHYEANHFHHVGLSLTAAVYNGCDYCHSITPHKKDEKARAFRNLHGYVMACETCHYLEGESSHNKNHRWVDVESKKTIVRPANPIKKTQVNMTSEVNSPAGSYNARIAPWFISDEASNSVIGRPGEENARSLLASLDNLKRNQLKGILMRMHKGLTKKPYECADCHTKKNPVMAYERLGYSKQEALKLMDSEIASLISQYNKFHFPDLFVRKDDRNKSGE